MDHIDVIEALESKSDKLISQLLEKAPGASEETLDFLIDFLGTLKKDASGKVVQSVENLKAINNFRPKINEFIRDSDYGKASSDFGKSFKGLTNTMDDYFASMAIDIGNNSELYKGLVDANIYSTVDGLTGIGLEDNITSGITDIMKETLASGDRSVMKAALKDFLIKDSKLTRYAETYSNQAVSQFNSNYMNSVSADLGLNHYFYKGTKITDTRSFCNKLAGKYFTEEQLREIVTTESQKNGGKGWPGMIAGTNWTNFPINRGGWNCRHYLIPVSKAIYDRSPHKYVP